MKYNFGGDFLRLIDADELMKEFEKNGTWWEQVRLEEAPTVDAVQVVRCKDCIYRDCNREGQPNIICYQMHDDDFCSYGERE